MSVQCRQNNDLLLKRDIFEQYRARSFSLLSTHSFVSIFAWQDFFDYRFDVVAENLCVFAGHDLGEFLMLPPLGDKSHPQVAEHCFKRMIEVNGPVGVSRIDNVSLNQLDHFDVEQFDVYCKGYEYCYFRKDIEQLKGNAYKSQRGEINRFQQNDSYVFRPYENSMLEDCLRLYECWSGQARESKDDLFCQMIEEGRQVHRRVLESFNELNMIGRVVEVNGQVKAYTFGYAVTSKVFCVLMEVADRDVRGLSAFIFREFCADPQVKRFSFINVMDDWGLDNLSTVKLAYHPALLLPAYTVTKKERMRE